MRTRLTVILAVLTATVLVVSAGSARTRDASDIRTRVTGRSATEVVDAALGATPATGLPEPLPAVEGAEGATSTGSMSDEDLRTFAFASSDLASLRSSLDATVADAEALTSAADSWDMASMRRAGEALRGHARELSGNASTASMRLQSLAPANATLRAARADSLAAFALAASQAQAAIQLAEFAITLDPAKAATAFESINALGRGETGVTAALEEISAVLESWGAANPEAAARALIAYA